jgi:predicted nucleic acid-binding protein
MTAGDSFFLDTNILLYRLSINEPAKQRAAPLLCKLAETMPEQDWSDWT